jgi:hypothetical protein
LDQTIHYCKKKVKINSATSCCTLEAAPIAIVAAALMSLIARRGDRRAALVVAVAVAKVARLGSSTLTGTRGMYENYRL